MNHGIAIFAVEIGRDESGEVYAVMRGKQVALPGDPEEVENITELIAAIEPPDTDAPIMETLLRRDEETSLWRVEEVRVQVLEEGALTWEHAEVEGMADNPLELARSILEGPPTGRAWARADEGDGNDG